MNVGLIGKYYRGMEALDAGLREASPSCRPVALGSGPVVEVIDPGRMDAFFADRRFDSNPRSPV